MAYADKNFKTKKAFKVQTVEGPHYPEPHKWYATATLDEDGAVVKVI